MRSFPLISNLLITHQFILTSQPQVCRHNLCNYYCANQCPIGQQYVPEIKTKDLSQIVLEMLASLNSMNKQKERMERLLQQPNTCISYIVL